jgi:DNA-binding CsgD family transcriptional regulator
MTDPDFRRRVGSAAQGIPDCVTADDLKRSLTGIADAFGAEFGHVSLRYGQRHADEPALLLATYAPDAVRSYLTRRAFDFDPVARHLQSSTTVAASEELDWSSTAAQEVRELKQRFGVGPSGLCVSVFGPCGAWGMVTLSSSRTPAPWSGNMAEARCMFSRIGTLFFEQMLKAAPRQRAVSHPLSRREAEALTWTAKGKTIAETAIILGLAASTVRHLIDAARHKLEAATKTEAVAKALTRRLIQAA